MKFELSNNNKRYHTLDYYYKNKFNCKIMKISLNAGFSCPHINTGGCIYCSKTGSGEYAGNVEKDLITQFNEQKEIMNKKWPNGKYIGYFQARTNTFAPVKILKEKYEIILKQKDVIGLSIATRPDCINNECLEYLEDLNKRTFLTVELGLQTIHEKTSNYINRGHDLECFKECVSKLRNKNINVVVHIINGLPYETKEDMIETVKYLSNKKILGIKIHMLHILKNTKLFNMYLKEKFHVLTKEEQKAMEQYERDRLTRTYAYKPNIRKWDYVFSGKLRFSVLDNKHYRDGEYTLIEQRLPEILVDLYEESENVKIQRMARETAARKAEEERKAKERRQEIYNEEVERVIALENEAEDYALACKIRAYVSAVEAQKNFDENTQRWVDWAKEKADWYDPLIAKEDELIGRRDHKSDKEQKQLKKRHSYFW